MKIVKVCALLVSVLCGSGTPVSGMDSCSLGVRRELIELAGATVVAAQRARHPSELEAVYADVSAALAALKLPEPVETPLLSIITGAHKNPGVALFTTPPFIAFWNDARRKKSPCAELMASDFRRITAAHIGAGIERDPKLQADLSCCLSIAERAELHALVHSEEDMVGVLGRVRKFIYHVNKDSFPIELVNVLNNILGQALDNLDDPELMNNFLRALTAVLFCFDDAREVKSCAGAVLLARDCCDALMNLVRGICEQKSNDNFVLLVRFLTVLVICGRKIGLFDVCKDFYTQVLLPVMDAGAELEVIGQDVITFYCQVAKVDEHCARYARHYLRLIIIRGTAGGCYADALEQAEQFVKNTFEPVGNPRFDDLLSNQEEPHEDGELVWAPSTSEPE